MKKFVVSLYVKIEADSLEDANQLANEIRVYNSLDNGGDELDPSVTEVTELQPVVKYDPIGYQVIDKRLVELHPDMDGSFCIYSKPQALAMIESTKHQVDRNYELLPIKEGDVEDPTFMFEGDPETATEIEPSTSFMERVERALAENNPKLNKFLESIRNDEDVDTVFLNALKTLDAALDNVQNAHNQVDETKYNVGEFVSNMRFYMNSILIQLEKLK